MALHRETSKKNDCGRSTDDQTRSDKAEHDVYPSDVVDGGEMCSGCGYTMCGTEPCRRRSWIQQTERLRIQYGPTDLIGDYEEWTTSGEMLLLASKSTTDRTARIEEPQKEDLLPSVKKPNREEDLPFNKEDDEDEILPIQ